METVIFTLFNYGSDCREAYLLLQLFTAALRYEIKYIHLLHLFTSPYFLFKHKYRVYLYVAFYVFVCEKDLRWTSLRRW